MKENYNRNVQLICPNCGCKNFKYDSEDENSIVNCLECNLAFTRDEIIKKNQQLIDENLNEMKEQITIDIKNDLKKIFSNNKNFKIK